MSVSAGYVLAQPGGGVYVRTDLSGAAEDLFARNRNVSVSQRPREGYDARGLRAGAFLVYPKVAVTTEASDNIYSRPSAKDSDIIWRVAPEVTVVSDLPRHFLSA